MFLSHQSRRGLAARAVRQLVEVNFERDPEREDLKNEGLDPALIGKPGRPAALWPAFGADEDVQAFYRGGPQVDGLQSSFKGYQAIPRDGGQGHDRDGRGPFKPRILRFRGEIQGRGEQSLNLFGHYFAGDDRRVQDFVGLGRGKDQDPGILGFSQVGLVDIPLTTPPGKRHFRWENLSCVGHSRG